MIHNSYKLMSAPRWARKLSVFALIALPGLAAHAATINVPGDAANIQAGIDMASSGDTVLVAPGTYNEHDIVFGGKEVELKSSGGRDVTTIDANMQGPVLKIVNGEGRNAVVDGFTIQNGRANEQPEGGGIQIVNSSPTIRNNLFRNNENNQIVMGDTSNMLGAGGGVKISSGGNPLIEGNTFRGNRAIGNGGAIRLRQASAEIRNNIFDQNEAYGTGSTDINAQCGDMRGCGGGVNLSAGDFVSITDNVFTNNVADNVAGALSVFDTNATITGNTFTGNFAQGFAGGIRIEDERNQGGRTVTVQDNVFQSNSTGNKGGGIHLFFEAGNGDTRTGGSDVQILNNSFVSNTASSVACTADLDPDCASGGGLQVIRFTGNNSNPPAWGMLTVRGNTFTDNFADNYGAAQFNAANLLFEDNLVENNSAMFRYPGISCEYNSNSQAPCLVRGNKFIGNAATNSSGGGRNAGGIYVKDPLEATVENNFFANNEGDRGAAIYYINTIGGQLSVINNSFSGNNAAFAGGGSVYLNGDGTARNNVFQGDLRGIRVHADAQVVDIDNNNFTGQSSGVARQGGVNFSTVAELNSQTFATGNTALAPDFINAANGDLHLDPSSDLIDLISCTGAPDTDIDGDNRPLGSQCEPGADEFDPIELDRIFKDGFED